MSVAVAAAALSALSCAPDVSDEHFYQDFVRDAQAMQQMGLPTIWLGREFTAGDLTFRGPFGSDFGGEVQGGGIHMTYTARLGDGAALDEGPSTVLELTIYSPTAWELKQDSMMKPGLPGVTRRDVLVGDRRRN